MCTPESISMNMIRQICGFIVNKKEQCRTHRIFAIKISQFSDLRLTQHEHEQHVDDIFYILHNDGDRRKSTEVNSKEAKQDGLKENMKSFCLSPEVAQDQNK